MALDNRNLRPATGSCPSCFGETLGGVSTCPTCGAVLSLELAVQDAKQAGLKRLSPILASIRSDPVSMLAWVLSIIPFLVVPPTLAILLALYTNKSHNEQRRWLYAVAALNICLSLYFWSWAGDYVTNTRLSILDWLWSVWAPHPRVPSIGV